MNFVTPFYVDFGSYCPKCIDFRDKHYEQARCKECMKIPQRFIAKEPVLFTERREEVTDYGYDYIIEQIKQTPAELPSAGYYNATELSAWIEGYKACYDNNIALIESIKEANCQRN